MERGQCPPDNLVGNITHPAARRRWSNEVAGRWVVAVGAVVSVTMARNRLDKSRVTVRQLMVNVNVNDGDGYGRSSRCLDDDWRSSSRRWWRSRQCRGGN